MKTKKGRSQNSSDRLGPKIANTKADAQNARILALETLLIGVCGRLIGSHPERESMLQGLSELAAGDSKEVAATFLRAMAQELHDKVRADIGAEQATPAADA